MKTKTRKGAMHALEGLLAFSIVVGFILFVMPAVEISTSSGHKTHYVYSTLETLESKGILRAYAFDNNMTGLNTTLKDLLPTTYNFAVGMSQINATHKTISGNHSFNYTIDTTKRDYVKLDFILNTATDPNIYLNGNIIYSSTGDSSGILESIDLTDNTIDGENQLTFNFTGIATFDYRLLMSESEDLSSPPFKKDIDTVNYFVSGIDSTFLPTIVRVYLW
ncbi:MAG: hypothetical protein GQ477_01175 [Nanohaloarchaea archaeon]|nr:hypothetical protein [Candidatus Nanohaloarchaea archaeon]